jgi:hypothetical protein
VDARGLWAGAVLSPQTAEKALQTDSTSAVPDRRKRRAFAGV